jgi:hypothetical protein
MKKRFLIDGNSTGRTRLCRNDFSDQKTKLIGGDHHGSKKEKESKEEEVTLLRQTRMESLVSSTGFPSRSCSRAGSPHGHAHF